MKWALYWSNLVRNCYLYMGNLVVKQNFENRCSYMSISRVRPIGLKWYLVFGKHSDMSYGFRPRNLCAADTKLIANVSLQTSFTTLASNNVYQ